MQILQVGKFHWLRGGADKVYLDTIALLKSKGHDVIPFSMQHIHNIASEYDQYFVDEVDYDIPGLANKLSSAAKVIYSIDAKSKMKLLLRNIEPALAHFHSFQHQISPSVFRPLKQKRIPLILTLHDLKPLCPVYTMLSRGMICERCMGGRYYHCAINCCNKGSFSRSIVNVAEAYLHRTLGYYREVDAYIAVSKFYRAKMIEYGFPASKIYYLPNALDLGMYPYSPDDDGYILYIGRLSEEKGLDVLITAMCRFPATHLIIAGCGPIDETLKRHAETVGARNVIFVGHKSTLEVRQLLRKARLTVLPSIWYENCPMSILESMAMGKPVIGSRIGGIPELIDDGLDGLTFEPGNVDDLAVKIAQLLGNPTELGKMGVLGRMKIEQRFSLVGYYEKLMTIYRKTIVAKNES